MSSRALLRALEELPDEALVPAGWVRDQLQAERANDKPLGDLSVEDAGAILDRAPSTIRGWLANGELRGYKRRGREWRIPRSAIVEFQEQERRGETSSLARQSGGQGKPDLSSWREEFRDVG